MFAKQRIKDETQQKLSPILTLFKQQYQEFNSCIYERNQGKIYLKFEAKKL